MSVPGNQQPLVEFRAGRVKWDGRTVTPEKAKGKLQIVVSRDNHPHVQWINRDKNNTVEEDVSVVGGDAVLEKIKARVYVLRTSDDRKILFWMQEPDETKDEENVARFNNVLRDCTRISGMPNVDAARSGSGARSLLLAESMQALASAARSGPPMGAGSIDTPSAVPHAPPVTPAATTTAANTHNIQQRQIAQIISSLAAATRAQSAQQARQGQGEPLLVPLSAVLTSSSLKALCEDEAAAAELKQHLPAGQRSDQDLKEAVTSPQLGQAMSMLSQAIHSEQLPVLLTSLGVDAGVVAECPDGMTALCQALQSNGSTGLGGNAPNAPPNPQ